MAINKDEEAPVFLVANYSFVGDVLTVSPEPEKALQAVSRSATRRNALRILAQPHFD